MPPELPEHMLVWVHGTMFRLGFPTQHDRDYFRKEVGRGSQIMAYTRSLEGQTMFIRPSSVDAYRVIQ